MAAPSFPSTWEGSLERKPGRQVAEKDIRSRGSSRESKQTGLCVAADWRLGRESRPVVVGKGRGSGGGGGEGREARSLLWTRDKQLEQPRLGV